MSVKKNLRSLHFTEHQNEKKKKIIIKISKEAFAVQPVDNSGRKFPHHYILSYCSLKEVSQRPVSQRARRYEAVWFFWKRPHCSLSATRSEQHKVPGSGDAPLWRPDERPLSLLWGQGGRQVIICAATLHDGEGRVFLLGRRLQHLEQPTSPLLRASLLTHTGQVSRWLWKYQNQCVASPHFRPLNNLWPHFYSI